MTICQIIYQRPNGATWIGAEAVELPDPAAYAHGLVGNLESGPNRFAATAYVIERETGKSWGRVMRCPYCEKIHHGPYTGLCLL